VEHLIHQPVKILIFLVTSSPNEALPEPAAAKGTTQAGKNR